MKNPQNIKKYILENGFTVDTFKLLDLQILKKLTNQTSHEHIHRTLNIRKNQN